MGKLLPKPSPPRTSLILKRAGTTRAQRIRADTVEDEGKTYGVETRAHFWVNRDIPAGWLTVHVQDDPEPVTDRKAMGYGPRTLTLLKGPFLPSIYAEAMRGKAAVPDWMKWVLIGLVGACALGVGVWWFVHKYGGA